LGKPVCLIAGEISVLSIRTYELEAMIANNVLDMIGNTPLAELTKLDTGKCRLFLKLENQNPGGSIKDRIGLSMIAAAEKDGKLKPGGMLYWTCTCSFNERL
jgi:threonine dehydratase